MAIFSRRVGSAVTLGALGVAVVALLIPMSDKTDSSDGAPSSTACPLGYTESDGVPLPDNHPPVARHAGKLSSAPGDGDGSILYINATVWTGDPQAPWADSFSVSRDGRVLDVGRGGRLPKGGYHDYVVDLNEKFVAPGLIDAHIHFILGGLSLRQLDMSRVHSMRGFTETVERAVAGLPNDRGWLLGRGWNNDHWGGQMPRVSWIDQITMGRPVLLVRYDLHCALVNSEALRLAGLTPETPDPPGGVIERDADGSLTGLLKDSAISLVNAVIPAPTDEENRDALDRATEYLLAQGVTAVHDMGRADFLEGPDAAWRDFENVLLPAANEGRLKMRVHSALPLSTRVKVKGLVEALGWSHPGGFLTWGTLKAFADGSLGSRTAKMQEPYADVPSTGIWVTNMTKLREDIIAADANGMQVAVHAIGDEAVDELLTYFSAARSENGPRDASLPRHRIEHAQHISGSETVSNMLAAGVQVVTNPLHLLDDRWIIPHCLGSERSAPTRAFPQESFIKAGISIACGSDWPVVEANALLSMYAGVYRRAIGDTGSHEAPSGGMTLEQALQAHTSRAGSEWFAGGSSGRSGRLAAGFLADFVVLSDNPLKGHDSMAGVRVLQTFVGGQCVFNASGGMECEQCEIVCGAPRARHS